MGDTGGKSINGYSFRSWRLLIKKQQSLVKPLTNQNVFSDNLRESQILNRSLLNLDIGAAIVAVLWKNLDYGFLQLGEEVDELHVGWEEKLARRRCA